MPRIGLSIGLFAIAVFASLALPLGAMGRPDVPLRVHRARQMVHRHAAHHHPSARRHGRFRRVRTPRQTNFLRWSSAIRPAGVVTGWSTHAPRRPRSRRKHWGASSAARFDRSLGGKTARSRGRAGRIRLRRASTLPASKYPEPGDNLRPSTGDFDPVSKSVFVGECYSVGPCRLLQYGPTGRTTWYAGLEAKGTVTGDGGPATAAHFSATGTITTDGAGALYASDRYELRRIDPVTHIISRFAGNGQDCNTPVGATVGATANAVSLHPSGVGVDPITGNIWVYDECNHNIDAISPNGVVVWQSPNTGTAGEAYLMVFDSSGRAYWLTNYKVNRMNRDGTITTVAGTGTSGSSGDGGPATSATLGSGSAIAIDAQDQIYIATNFPQRLRRIDTQGIITSLNDTSVYSGYAGDGGALGTAQFSSVYTLDFDPAGDLYVSDSNNNRIRMIAPSSTTGVVDSSSIIQTFAGGVGASNTVESMGGGNPSELCAGNCDDDVDSATAEYAESQDDLGIPGRGIALDFARSYSSIAAGVSGHLGNGWTDSYNMSLEVDAASNNVIIHQENGAQLAFYPDGSGHFSGPSRQLATLVANADGSFTLTRMARAKFTFDAAGRLVTERDLNGYTTTLAYDASNRLSTITDPVGRTLILAYDANSRISSVTDSAGRQVSYAYDGAGNLTTVTDVRGKAWSYAYDANHLLVSRTDPNGHLDVVNAYDSIGRLTSQKDALNRTRTWSFAQGVTTITSPAGNVTKNYYSNGALWKETKGYGTSVAASTTFGYDAKTMGVTLTTDPNGHTWSATYDTAGNQLTATDPLAHKTTNTYDTLNDLKSSQDPKGVTTTYTYDAAGNRLTESTPLVGSSPAQNQVTTYTYGDGAHPGDITAVQDPNGKTTTNTYTGNGDLASVTDPLGNKTSYGYDALGRRTSMVSPRGNATGADPADYTTNSTYDAAGNKLTTTDPLGHVSSSTYDDAGNLASSTDADNHTTSYVYDAADQQTEIHRPDGSILKSSFDADGNLASQTDGANNSTSYLYDALDRQASKLDPLNRTTAYGYDAAGNQTTVTDALNRTTTKNYDNANRLTSIGYSDGVTPGATFSYDADDQRTAMIDGTGSSSWTYDSLHRVTQYTNGHGDSLGFGYDLAGHKTRITYPGSHNVTYSYDDAGRMSGLTDWLSHTTTFGYDRDANQTSTTFPSSTGNVDTYTYDRAGRQGSTTIAGGSTTLASLDYTRDAKGLLTHVDATGLPGTAAHTYSYTSLDQLAADNSDAYAYDAADNPTTLAGVSGGTFDVANQLTSNAGGSFGYDALGERTSSTPTGGSATNYGYDQAGRLTSFTPPSGSAATYAYDGTGLRMSKTVGATTTRFLWDPTGSLPLMIHDGSTSYVYGPDGTVVEQISSGGTPTYYHHDYLGSTRALTDASGAVTATFTYSPYGTLLSSTGSQTTPYGVDGEYVDSESGLVYLRARYYDPATGQFVSVDPLVSATRAAYEFANGDPVDQSDPSGLASGDGTCGGNAEDRYATAKAALVAALSAVYAKCVRDGRCQPMDKYKTPTERHHIVPVRDGRHKGARVARRVLASANISVQAPINIIDVVTGIHRRLHTGAWYTALAGMLTAGRDIAGRAGVVGAMGEVRAQIRALNTAVKLGLPFPAK